MAGFAESRDTFFKLDAVGVYKIHYITGILLITGYDLGALYFTL
jgi:hypothetical protein